MIDLNFKRSRRERAISDEIAAELVCGTSATTAEPELLARIIGAVCRRRGWALTERELARVLACALKTVDALKREADALVAKDGK
jgi:hypothetical protein